MGAELPVGWIISGIGAVVTALSGAVTVLWRNHVKDKERVEKKLDECESQHEESTQQLIGLSSEVGELRGKVGTLEEMFRDR